MISTFKELSSLANYSFIDELECDPDAQPNGTDHAPRQVFTGHYVPVKPTPIKEPEYIAHSNHFFSELGFTDKLATSLDFIRMFSGDLSQVSKPMYNYGWATGYALSIYGTEYYQQCPFQTGNGYGDGRAISVFEGIINGQRWEMQLKGGGRTPYCRGADGRAVLRSSVREFLAQEHMHALGIPTSRSLCLFVSKSDTVQRPWYSEGSMSFDPDIIVSEPVAITTRVAPSFIRVGQIELFGRRARKQEHPKAMEELEQIVLHLIDREYPDCIEKNLSITEKIFLLAQEFSNRLSSLVANWIRVGYCQGNFNSDNCAVGGFTLDYGPFGFCDVFHPQYQPWTGGGEHFSFLNQPLAAQQNFNMFCKALQPLLVNNKEALHQLRQIQSDFAQRMQTSMEQMWCDKLGLSNFNAELLHELGVLMVQTPVDYTIFFRELSKLPDTVEAIKKSFYRNPNQPTTSNNNDSIDIDKQWSAWLKKWQSLISSNSNLRSSGTLQEISEKMLAVNPKYILREWMLAPAYQQAVEGNYELLREIQAVMIKPYAEQSKDIEEKYYKLRPSEMSKIGGLSHLSCSS
ncbi:MAG: YdiU family protein [Gammaproteobacteria bacterium]|nr:YdiU family protein [Gammaproteobacteria bacterium]